MHMLLGLRVHAHGVRAECSCCRSLALGCVGVCMYCQAHRAWSHPAPLSIILVTVLRSCATIECSKTLYGVLVCPLSHCFSGCGISILGCGPIHSV